MSKQVEQKCRSRASSMEKMRGKGERLLLMASPFQGHITPLLHLAQILHSKFGFSITIIHITLNSNSPVSVSDSDSDSSSSTSSYPHFTFHTITPHGLSDLEASTTDSIHLTHLINITCINPLKQLLSVILLSKEEKIACFIADAALHFTQSVCDAFKLPRFVIRTGSASSFLLFASFPLLRQKGYFPIQESRLEDPVDELPPLKVKDLPMFETRDPDIFYNLTCSVVGACKASSGVIWNTFNEFESSSISKLSQEFRVPIYPIGPFHKHSPAPSTSSNYFLTPDKTCISWLDTKEPKSVVYVSFGSMAKITEAQFLEMAWGLANSNQPFLWVVRPGLVRGSEWLEPLPSGFMESLGGRGYIVKWAPQEQVLGHVAVGAFWSHGGWNSILESICEGVPMICMPCFGDQKVNAKYVSAVWKIGVQLKGDFERSEVEKAIRKLMVGDEGKVIRESVLNLKEKVNLCLEQGGSSYCSLDGLVSDILLL